MQIFTLQYNFLSPQLMISTKTHLITGSSNIISSENLAEEMAGLFRTSSIYNWTIQLYK